MKDHKNMPYLAICGVENMLMAIQQSLEYEWVFSVPLL